MVIRDDGCGMDKDVVRSGREGHWGLAGMSERSERIGGRLTVLSAPGGEGRRSTSWFRVRLPLSRELPMNESAPIRILCVDDHPLFREGIATVIANQPGMTVASMAATATEAIEEYVTLMDLRLPDMSGIAALAAIRSEFPDARTIMLTTFEGDVEVQRALAAGTHDYLLKSTRLEELVAVIREVHLGRKHLPAGVAQTLAEQIGNEVLSEREIQVLKRIAEGNRNKDIGVQRSISEETENAHVRHILEKLNAKDRTQADVNWHPPRHHPICEPSFKKLLTSHFSLTGSARSRIKSWTSLNEPLYLPCVPLNSAMPLDCGCGSV